MKLARMALMVTNYTNRRDRETRVAGASLRTGFLKFELNASYARPVACA